MSITFQSALEYGPEPTAALLTEGFSGYFVPIQMTGAGLLTMIRQDSVDLQSSRVILQDDRPVGVALVARRGWTSRIAAMSIIPEARGHGAGAVCVRQLLQEAKARQDKAMTLEVIEQNTPAVRLYEKCGFQIQRRLVGYVGQIAAQECVMDLEEIDVRDAARALTAYGPDDLPWQVSGETLAQFGPPLIAYRSANSWLALSNPAAPTINVRGIVTLPDARRKGSATALLRAAIALHPGKIWRVAPHLPEEFGGLFEGIGLIRDTLAQWQMRVIRNGTL